MCAFNIQSIVYQPNFHSKWSSHTLERNHAESKSRSRFMRGLHSWKMLHKLKITQIEH